MSTTEERTAGPIVHLDDCGCCEGLTARTPARVYNRPGLNAIAYRTGTHELFKASLLARLSSSDLPELAPLRTRDDDDFSIALLDAWATVADVLTFYQERLANESYLRTATERRSIDELARLVGYRLSPGVAASAYLAFTLEEAPGAPEQATPKTTIDAGTRVQSTPGPGEEAQTFETIEKIEGRVGWNAIKPRLTKRQALSATTNQLSFAGLATQLKAGDGVLFETDGGDSIFGVVTEVTPEPEENRTAVKVGAILSSPLRGSAPSLQPAAPTPVPPPAADYLDQTLSAADLAAEAEIGKFEVQALFDVLEANLRPEPKALVFRRRAAVFGHNAAPWKTLPISLREQEKVYNVENDGSVTLVKTVNGAFFDQDDGQGDWQDKLLSDVDGDQQHVCLDHVCSDVAAGSWVVLRDQEEWAIYNVDKVAEVSHSGFNVTAKVTRLTLDNDDQFDAFGIRTTSVYAQSEELALARVPEADEFAPDANGWLELDGWVDGLFVGQRIATEGEVKGTGAEAAEVSVVSNVEHVLTQEGGGTRIQLRTALANQYVRTAVTLNANVALATHGETVQEVLGSGDARRTYQQFTLAQPPLTHVSAETATGTESTLEVRVNDVRWDEVPTVYGRGPEERLFVTRTGDDGQTAVQFGDGLTGARLPTGPNNVRARYRKGIGLGGLVGAGQLNLLMQRPLGVKGVRNPLAASGGDDPELRDEARRNAPLSVLTLGRVVSLRDYEDFARAFAGVAKALATWIWDGCERGVFLTVAGPEGAAIEAGSPLHENLVAALAKAGDPYVSVRVATYRPALFHLAVKVKVDDDYLPEKVLPAVETALRARFAFAAREFGRPVAASEVVAAVQAVAGVVAVDLDKLYRSGAAAEWNRRLAAELPLAGTRGDPLAAELLTLHPGPLAKLEEMP